MARMEGLTLTRGNRGLLLIALMAGLIAAGLVFVALAQTNEGGSARPSTGGATIKTVVAAQDIPAGSDISQEMVKVADMPESLRVEGAFSDPLPVVGEVTKVAISRGEAITPPKIGPLVEGEGTSNVVPDGLRGFGVRVEEVTAVGGNLLPGDRVDVIAVFPEDANKGLRPVALTVLQNVEVLSVAQESLIPYRADGDSSSDVATSGELPEDVKEHPSAVTITLAVDPAQAQVLALVQEEATKVYTSLRPFGEEDPVNVPAVDISTIRPQ